jgi:Family of unknown function (DUF5317)
MRLMAFALATSVLIGFALRGRLANLGRMRLHWMPLALIGAALQFVTGPGTAFPLTCLYVSFVLLTIFAIKNIKIAGFAVIMVGIALNFLVIALNAGMPVSVSALRASGQGQFLHDLKHDPYPKHHVATPDDAMGFLGDVIPVPPPVAQVVSIGDLFTYAGVVIVIAAGMRSPVRRPEDTDESASVHDAREVQHAGS